MKCIKKKIEERIETLNKKIETEYREKQESPHIKEMIGRSISSLKKRLDHYQAFAELITDK